MSLIKIVHFSPTPLVGAPGKISLVQRMQGDDSICFMASDYPRNGPLYKFFSDNSILIRKENLDFFKYKISSADVIHVHNYIEKEMLDLITSLNTSAKLIYQVHSPIREGPLYYPREFDAEFDVHLVVAQHWTRFYPSYIPVPNLILEPPSIRERAKGQKLKVLFSPTHKHAGRWTDKHTPGLEDLLSSMHKSNLIDFHKPMKPIDPIELNMIRKCSDVTLDEIQTGGFHMVSLEGLAFGNVVVNNADYFAKEILFGKEVSKIVDGLTKISKLSKEKRVSIQAENFKKMLLSINDDVRVILIKIADRLHNMMTLDFLGIEKQVRISSETLFIYAPLAHRIGMYNIKTKLEYLSLKFTEPDVYHGIEKKIKESENDRLKYIKNFSKKLEGHLKTQKILFRTEGRFKSIFSIRKKMQLKNKKFDEVFDQFAVRIIYKSNQKNEKFLAWKIYSIVTDHFQPNPTRLRDWISSPKSTGYEALHITIVGPSGKWIEVQIRSERMH